MMERVHITEVPFDPDDPELRQHFTHGAPFDVVYRVEVDGEEVGYEESPSWAFILAEREVERQGR